MDKENQPITSGIKHWGLSGYSSVLPRIKFGVTGQDSSPQSPTISYRHPLAVSRKKKKTVHHNVVRKNNNQGNTLTKETKYSKKIIPSMAYN